MFWDPDRGDHHGSHLLLPRLLLALRRRRLDLLLSLLLRLAKEWELPTFEEKSCCHQAFDGGHGCDPGCGFVLCRRLVESSYDALPNDRSQT